MGYIVEQKGLTIRENNRVGCHYGVTSGSKVKAV